MNQKPTQNPNNAQNPNTTAVTNTATNTTVAQLFLAAFNHATHKNLYSAEGAQLYAQNVHTDTAECAEIHQISHLLPPNATVGELAAGEGRLLFSLPTNKINTYTALDTSPLLLNALKQRAQQTGIPDNKLHAIHQDITTWKPTPNTYDLLILGAGTIRLFPTNKRQTIYNIVHTALKPEGYFYISTSEPINQENGFICLGQTQLRNSNIVAYFYDIHIDNLDARETGFIVFPIGKKNATPRIYNSIVHNLNSDKLSAELQAADFKIIDTIINKHEDNSGVREKTTSIIAQKTSIKHGY